MKMLQLITISMGTTLALGLFTEANAAQRLQNVVRRLSGPDGLASTNVTGTFRCAGTVVDADGKPVAGAVVECYPNGGGGRAARGGGIKKKEHAPTGAKC